MLRAGPAARTRQTRLSNDPETSGPGGRPLPEDASALRAELAAERRSRAWLEARLEELDQRLRRAQASERALQNAAAQEQVAFLGLHAAQAAEVEAADDRESLALWLEQAMIVAEAEAAPVTAPAVGAEPIPAFGIAAAPADDRYAEKLAAARRSIEAAEARAEHNAAQVRRLSEELAAARAEQVRTAARLHEIEKKFLAMEARAELLDSALTERAVPQGAPEFELPPDTLAPLAPEKPGLVYTETELGEQLMPAEAPMDGPAAQELAAALEDFEPRLAQAEPAVAPRDEVADALADLFGAPDDDAPVPAPAQSDAPTALERPAAATEVAMDSLAEALEMWGSGPAVTFDAPHSAPDTPAPLADESRPTAAMPAREAASADPFGDLASALESLSDVPLREIATGESEEPVAETVLELEAAPFANEDQVPETEMGAPERSAAEDERGEDSAAEQAAAPEPELEEERQPESAEVHEDAAAPARRGLRDAMQAPAGERAVARGASEGGGRKRNERKGREAMVDALLNFMGPKK